MCGVFLYGVEAIRNRRNENKRRNSDSSEDKIREYGSKRTMSPRDRNSRITLDTHEHDHESARKTRSLYESSIETLMSSQ